MEQRISYALLFIVLSFALWSVQGQAVDGDAELYRLPNEYSLSFAALQKDLSVEFEDVAILVRKNGESPLLYWSLKNNAKKSVRQFEVEFNIYTNVKEWAGFRGLTGYDFSSMEVRHLIRPGEVYRSSSYSSEKLPNEIHRMLRSANPGEEKRFIVVRAMVKKVTFDDGTVLEDDKPIFSRL